MAEEKPAEHKHGPKCGCRPKVFSFKDAARRTQQPNDKCACMSGKKFKKCCGR